MVVRHEMDDDDDDSGSFGRTSITASGSQADEMRLHFLLCDQETNLLLRKLLTPPFTSSSPLQNREEEQGDQIN